MSLVKVLAQYSKPALNGLTMQQADRVAGLSNVLMNWVAHSHTPAENAYWQGKKAFQKDLRDVRYQHPYGSWMAELAGQFLPVRNATRGAMTLAELAELLRKPYNSVKGPYPRRTPQQWREDLEYGRQEFNKLRKLGPLKREGQPDVAVIHKSWDKIRGGNIPEKYDMLRDVPDIYANGEYSGPTPAEPGHNNGFDQFHWYQQDNKGIQIGESSKGRMLYNVNPNVKRYLLEHPNMAGKLGVDITKL